METRPIIGRSLRIVVIKKNRMVFRVAVLLKRTAPATHQQRNCGARVRATARTECMQTGRVWADGRKEELNRDPPRRRAAQAACVLVSWCPPVSQPTHTQHQAIQTDSLGKVASLSMSRKKHHTRQVRVSTGVAQHFWISQIL